MKNCKQCIHYIKRGSLCEELEIKTLPYAWCAKFKDEEMINYKLAIETPGDLNVMEFRSYEAAIAMLDATMYQENVISCVLYQNEKEDDGSITQYEIYKASPKC